MSLSYDLIVVGGGPGGASLATFVAMQGHKVLLLEREQFPRHQLGESLLPATIHGICPLLGVKEQIDAAGFPRKRGGTFRWGKSPDLWTFSFERTPNSPTGYAYQVERSRFDAILLDNARKRGVDVRELHVAQDPVLENDRVVGARFTDAAGAVHEARARFVADAEGHRTKMYKLAGDRVFSRFFQNVALFAYFENGKRLPAPNSGNILCAAFNDGWFWYIPLSDTLTSVGAVVSKESAEAALKGGNDAAFRSFVEACPIIAEHLAPATRVTTGMYGEYRVRKDYSYCNTAFWRPGLVLIGDAACFIDPVFSSGVHLATYSGLLAARSINTLLKGELDEATVFGEFERRYRREFGNFYQFLTAFYDMHRDASSYFWEARKVLNTEEKDDDAFVRLVAGLSETDEPQFAGGVAPHIASSMKVSAWFDGLSAQAAAPPPAVKGRPVIDKTHQDAEKFMDGFNREIMQLQLQAALGTKRPAEKALFDGGLAPSADGLHWRRVP